MFAFYGFNPNRLKAMPVPSDRLKQKQRHALAAIGFSWHSHQQARKRIKTVLIFRKKTLK
ncbi:MAG: hypothetical protein R3Y10_06600 [Ferrimonas sp.]